ncbi:hypothetical protein LCGC14_0500510 [marine sediment metagenome]|uniref:Uncharacterized protein n=1 Tax=marine sediment metagenome TaxID=412755 RepID=A0A0F9SMK2_9ZZZZ
MAPRKKRHYTFEECAKDRPDYVEHGSEQHANSIGLVEGVDFEPKEEAKLRAQLVEPPVVATRMPITRRSHRARTRRNPGTPIIDGWVRQGR